jgi:D-alanyl-D-alanine carboxypeptidase (penicillin-binding protein 5/6)
MRRPSFPARSAGPVAGTRACVLALALAVLVVCTAGPALAQVPRPTVDPSAPTPTAPPAGPPPQGCAPDGSIVGGEALHTRGLVAVPGSPPLPAGIDAHGWLVADATTGAVLAAQDPHGRYYPASTLKTLTLLTLAPKLDPAQVVEGTTEDENMEGSRVGLVRGGRYPVSLLFQALVLQSGNDAANALARAAGGVPATVAAMNATAERIGAYDTVVGTPSGLDVAGQSSSPYDLALIMRQLVAAPSTLAYLQTRTARLPDAPGHLGFQIQTQDTLLTSYPGTLGGKTGFTDAARHTFVAAAERNGRRLVVSLMQAERRPVSELQQAERLLDWGFAAPVTDTGVGRLVDPGEVPAIPAPQASPPPAAAPTSAPAGSATGSPTTVGSTTGQQAPPLGLAAGALVLVAVVVLFVRRRRFAGPAPGASSRGPEERRADEPGNARLTSPPPGRRGPLPPT